PALHSCPPRRSSDLGRHQAVLSRVELDNAVLAKLLGEFSNLRTPIRRIKARQNHVVVPERPPDALHHLIARHIPSAELAIRVRFVLPSTQSPPIAVNKTTSAQNSRICDPRAARRSI